jgi:hypothetical protein
MVASVEAQELEEDLARVNASIGDLVRESETEAMAGKTFAFSESLITEKMIRKMEKEGYFPIGQAEPPPAGQTVPSPAEGYAMVFRDYFCCGLHRPPITFLREVLEDFKL